MAANFKKVNGDSFRPPANLTRAREIAVKNGLHYAYTGNAHDKRGSKTYCHQCCARLISRDWYALGEWNLTEYGRCKYCGTPYACVFDGPPGN